MSETCKGMITQYTEDKQCILLVIIHIIQDTWSTEHKKPALLLSESVLYTILYLLVSHYCSKLLLDI
jgi:hypothetical protein